MARRRRGRTRTITRYAKKSYRRGKAGAFGKVKPMVIGLVKSSAIDMVIPMIPGGIGQNPMLKAGLKIGIGAVAGSKLGGGNNYVMYDGVKELVQPFLNQALGGIGGLVGGQAQGTGTATY